MIATKVLGSVHETAGAELVGGRVVDPVTLTGPERVKRVQRLRTAGGRELGLRLAAGSPALADGDVLAVDPDDGGTAVVVRVQASDVLAITPRSVLEMGTVAHTLGNRHLPAQFFGSDTPQGKAAGGETMLVEYDHTVETYLTGQGVPHRRLELALDVPFRHAEHSH